MWLPWGIRFIGGSDGGGGFGEKGHTRHELAIRQTRQGRSSAIFLFRRLAGMMRRGPSGLMQARQSVSRAPRGSTMKKLAVHFHRAHRSTPPGGVNPPVLATMLGGLNIGRARALIGFAGPRARSSSRTSARKTPEGFSASEFLLEHGFLDSGRAPQRFEILHR